MAAPSILFLLVNYFNDDEVINFIKKQLCTQSVQDWTVIVNDNGSHNPDLLKEKLSGIKNAYYVSEGTNTGYFNGAAFGLEFYQTMENGLPELIIVGNSDIEFESKNFIEQLLLLPTNYDVLGPRIRSSGSEFDLNPFSKKRFSENSLRFLYFLFSIYPLYVAYQLGALIKKNIFPKRRLKDQVSMEVVYAVHGSFMVFKKNYFEKGGKLKYDSFLYEEELYVAEQSRKLGLKTVYEPTISIIHHQHTTTGTIKSIKHIRFMRQSIKYLLKMYYHD